MKRIGSKMYISTKLKIYLAVLTLLFVVSFFPLVLFSGLRGNIALNLSVAGRNRSYTQRMAYLALKVLEGNDLYKTELVETMSSFEKSLLVMKEGGVLPGYTKRIVVNNAVKDMAPYLDQVLVIWTEYKDSLKIILNADSYDEVSLKNAILRIDDSSRKMLDVNRVVVEKYVERDDQLVSYIRLFMILMITAWPTYIFAFSYQLKTMFERQSRLAEYARRMVDEGLREELPIDNNDEIGELATAFNALISDIRSSYSSVEEKLDERTSKLRDSLEKLEIQNKELGESKAAMLNVMEDLDVEKRKLEEARLKDEVLLASIGDGMAVTDTGGNLEIVNKSFTDILGFSTDEVIGKRLQDVLKIVDSEGKLIKEQERPIFKVLKNKEKVSSSEYSYVRKDGSIVDVSITVSPVLMGKEIIGVFEVFRDISKEKEYLSQIERFKLAVEGASDQIVMTDAEGTVIYANAVLTRITGYTPEEAIGKKAGKLWGGLMDKEFYRVMWDTVKNKKKVYNGQLTNKRKDGTIYVADLHITPILDKSGKVQFFLAIERDITKEKEIDKMKSEFVSVASHELRTPLAAIDGLVSMILDGDFGQVGENLKQPLEDINTSSARMISLVNDLLNLSRIESGRLKFSLENVDIKTVVDSVFESLKSLAIPKKIKLIDKSISNKVYVDANKVTQVLTNLVGNALKFTDFGSVCIETKVNGSMLEVRVIDTGIGMKSSDKGKIFGKFQQLDTQKGRPAGTGLGLYLSRTMVKNMGGDLVLESTELGKGSTFMFTIPIAGSEVAKKLEEQLKQDGGENPGTEIDLIGKK